MISSQGFCAQAVEVERLADEARQLRWQHTRLVVGSNVRRLRLSRGLTQEALALVSGLSLNQLIEAEHGRRGLMFERLVDLADVLEAGSMSSSGRPVAGEASGVRTGRVDARVAPALVFRICGSDLWWLLTADAPRPVRWP